MPINTSQPPIIANTKLVGANVNSQIQGLRQQSGQLAGYTADAFTQLQQSINQIYSLLKAPGQPLQSFSVTDSNGALIAWAGSQVVNNISYEGIWAKMLYVGGDSAADAPFFTDGNGNVVIGNNGSVQIDNPLGVQEGFIGVNPDASINVMAVTNNGGLYEIQTATANTYITGDAVVTNLPGMPTGTGAFAITVIDPTHFTLNGSTFAGSYAGSGTVYRYYGGIWTQTAAFGGTGFADAPFRVFADGKLAITNADIDLIGGPFDTEVVMGPAEFGIKIYELDGAGARTTNELDLNPLLTQWIATSGPFIGTTSIRANSIATTGSVSAGTGLAVGTIDHLGVGNFQDVVDSGLAFGGSGGLVLINGVGKLSGVAGLPLSIGNGGTGGTTQATAQTALSVYSIAQVNTLLAAKANTGSYGTASAGTPAHTHGFTL